MKDKTFYFFIFNIKFLEVNLLSTQSNTVLKQNRKKKIKTTRQQIQEMYRDTQVKKLFMMNIYSLIFLGFCQERDREFQERFESGFFLRIIVFIYFFFCRHYLILEIQMLGR